MKLIDAIKQGDGDYVWVIGDAQIQRAVPGLETYERWARWQAWRQTDAGKQATRELAWEAIANDRLNLPTQAGKAYVGLSKDAF